MSDVHPAILPDAAARPWSARAARTRRASAAVFAALAMCALPAAGASLRYELDYAAEDEAMQVTLCADTAAAVRHFRLHRGGAAQLGEITRSAGPLIKTAAARWRAENWQAGECLRYRAELGPLSRSGDRERGSRVGATLVVAPQQWLLIADGENDAEVRVRLPPGFAFAAPWQPLADAADGARRFRIAATPPEWSALVEIGRFSEFNLQRDGGSLRVAVLGPADAARDRRLRAWLEQALGALATAYGRLPLAQAQVVLHPVDGRGRAVVFGQSLRGQGNAVHFWVDPQRPLAELSADWTATHEFAHWAHPYLGDDAWLSEGLASYWQNVLRARAGMLTPLQAWEQLDAGFGRGRAAADGEATLAELSATMHARRAYHAVYWAGAAFWLQSDLELRLQHPDGAGIDAVLQRFADCCLPARRAWDGADFVAKLDELGGGDVFRRRYQAFVAQRGFPPMELAYAQLGLQRDGAGLRLRDDAPAAAARDAIMRGTPRR